MHSLTAPSYSSLLFFPLTPRFRPSLIFSFRSTTTTTNTKRIHVHLHVHEGKKKTLRKNKGKGLCCNKDWDSASEEEEGVGGGGFSPLEAEILEFMKSSKNPLAFPTREELVAAGRVDLAEAIVKRGGWLAFGWDLDRGSRESHDFDGGFSGEVVDGIAATRASSGVASSSSCSSFDSDSEGNSGQPARSVEIEAHESGIEGILNRLEKERSSSFGLGFREKEESVSSENNEDKDEWGCRTTVDAGAADSRSSSLSPTSSPLGGFRTKLDRHRSHLGADNVKNSLNPDLWRSWIVQRTGFSDADFEDAEIAPNETQKGGEGNVSGGPDILKIREFSSEPVNRETGLGSLDGNANHSEIKYRIEHLESELSSVLDSLRSKSDKVTMQMDQKSSSDDLAKLSDAWEFQENEIMNAQDKLRSIRAKLAVLEGKMALAIMDAHKIVEEKQKRINNAHRALRVLKTACVVWPNTASEVFLAGSFDGWSTQLRDNNKIIVETVSLFARRKMEKSSTGIFSVYLQLYPGKYEIKFIVDGEWKIDPLRPTVNNTGYENNLLVIHD